jgi:hypothetical protein
MLVSAEYTVLVSTSTPRPPRRFSPKDRSSLTARHEGGEL